MLGYLRSGSKRTKLIWWAVTIATVFTFLIGFSFFGAMGRDSSALARQSGSYGMVNGERITREMWQNSLDAEKAGFVQRFGSEPVDRDLRAVEQQAWRKLVAGRLMTQAARKDGIKVTDNDVLYGMTMNPPAMITSAPAFQTNGKFDPAKYQAALANPNNDWSGFENQVRRDAPMTKLQERLMASLKLSEGELREALRDRYERMTAVVVTVPPADTGSTPADDAALQKIYDKYRALMAAPARTQLELLEIPIVYSPDEIKTAMDLANNLLQRFQHGEAFTQLCRDYSEGANADKGGVIDRFISAAELGPVGQAVQASKPGAVVGPFREGSTVMLFHVLDPARDSVARGAPAGSYKLAQLTIKVRGSQESLGQQYQAALKLAVRARSVGLGKIAAEKGRATTKTGFYDLDNMPPQLYGAPALADWGVSHKKGEVSGVFQTPDAFLIAQVDVQHAAGIPTREEVAEQLKAISDAEHRIDLSKPRADQIAGALQAGTSLEDAARAAGLSAMPVVLTRAQADPRLAAAVELQGRLWGARPGQVVGPVRTPAGWYFGRVTAVVPAPDTLWNDDKLKGQLTTEILTRRQRTFFNNYFSDLRRDARVVDSRGIAGY